MSNSAGYPKALLRLGGTRFSWLVRPLELLTIPSLSEKGEKAPGTLELAQGTVSDSPLVNSVGSSKYTVVSSINQANFSVWVPRERSMEAAALRWARTSSIGPVEQGLFGMLAGRALVVDFLEAFLRIGRVTIPPQNKTVSSFK